MGRTKYDADKLGAEYATARAAANGVLTQKDFFKSKGIPRRYGSKKFARTLDAYWERTRAAAETAITRRNGINMARELALLFGQGKELARRGYAMLTKPGKDGVEVEPATSDDALALFHEGSHGNRDIVKILTGGEPVQRVENVEPLFKWNQPIIPSKKKPKSVDGK